MAEKKPTAADEPQDPTIRQPPRVRMSDNGEDDVHAAPPVSEADDGPGGQTIEDLPDDEKPDPTTIAQREVLPDERS